MIRELFTEKLFGGLALGDRPVAEVCQFTLFLGQPVYTFAVGLLVLLTQTVVISTLLILLPLARFSREGLQVQNSAALLMYFAALGFGFISIEMALLSQLTGVLRHRSQPVGATRGRAPTRAATSFAHPSICIAHNRVLIPVLFRVALGPPLPLRVLLGVAALAPIGILLGMPFPTALRMVSATNSSLVPWSWGVNSFFTVIGTISAQILAMTFGFTFVLLCGATCYGIAWAVIGKMTATESVSAKSQSEGLLDAAATLGS